MNGSCLEEEREVGIQKRQESGRGMGVTSHVALRKGTRKTLPILAQVALLMEFVMTRSYIHLCLIRTTVFKEVLRRTASHSHLILSVGCVSGM